jgi:hypothetical protein
MSSLKILGFVIDNKLEKLTDNFDTAIDKITKIRNFWSRLKLSVAGRINIAKSLMLGQVNYFGCIITPTEIQAETIKSLIGNFVSAGINVARNRIFVDADQNGLNMIDPDFFVIAQQASWFKKINGKVIDNWRRKLHWSCGGNLFIADPQLFPRDRNPLVHNIVTSFTKFKTAFYKNPCGFEKAFLLHHPNFVRSRADPVLVNFSFFPQDLNHSIVTNLRFNDICDGHTLMRKTEIENNLGSEISLLFYLRLGEAMTTFFSRHNAPSSIKYPSMEKFFKL